MKQFLFLGDSITDCDHSFDKENLGNGYVRIIAQKLRFSYEIKNMGRDGFTLLALRRLWNMYQKEMHPSLITILVGINDISVMKTLHQDIDSSMRTFREDYEMLITQIRSHTDCPIVLLEPFIFPYPAEYASWERDVRKLGVIIKEVAASCNTNFLPLWDKLNTAAKIYGYDQITLDGIHLTQQGHKIIADAWLDWCLHTFDSLSLKL